MIFPFKRQTRWLMNETLRSCNSGYGDGCSAFGERAYVVFQQIIAFIEHNLDTTQYCDGQRETLHHVTLVAMARRFNSYSMLSWIKIRDASQNDQPTFDAFTDAWGLWMLPCIHTLFQPHRLDQNAGVPHFLYGRSTLSVSIIWHIQTTVNITSQNYTNKCMPC